MRNTLLCIAAFLSFYAGDVSSANKLYIVPADESGNIVEDPEGGYKGQLEMVQSSEDENAYSLANVSLPDAKFAVYGINEDNGMLTFYGTVGWAVSPVPVNYPSPLSIAPKGTLISLPETGTYDFEFFDRDVDGIAYHMLLPRPSEASSMIEYPSSLFLVDQSNNYTEIQGDMTTGLYAGDVEVPQDFRISYEPRYDMPPFIFGPSSDESGVIELFDQERVSISYAKGTSAVFNVSATARSSEENHIEINLREGYVVINDLIGTSVKAIEDSDANVRYLTLSGSILPGRPASPGLYIVLRNGVCSKIMM